MGFPWNFKETFEGGTKGNFDSESDTGNRLDFPGPAELAADGQGIAPFRGAYCMRVNLGKNATDAFVQELDGFDAAAGVARYIRAMLCLSPDTQFANNGDFVWIMQLQNGSAVVEGGRSVARDSVSGFSTTPASYTMSREADYQANARLRAGYTPGGGALFYVTGGGAYARLDNKFTTTNTANSFADNGKTNAWGYTVGGGAELMVTNNIGIGLEYLYTDVKDKDYVVNVGPGTAPATNPFLLAGAGGTDFRRSDDKFNHHAIRATAAFRF